MNITNYSNHNKLYEIISKLIFWLLNLLNYVFLTFEILNKIYIK